MTKWFQASWLIAQSKYSISTLELSRQISVKWDTGWRLRQKLASVMAEVEARRSFQGHIEMDDAVVDGVDTVSPTLYHVHADHLGRPIKLTDAAKASVWDAVWLPFGGA